jgi:hypothetical protein
MSGGGGSEAPARSPLSLAQVVRYAQGRCVQLSPTAELPNSNRQDALLPADQLRHSLRTAPLFDAAGQSLRFRAMQDKLLKRSVLATIEDHGKVTLVSQERKRRKVKPKPGSTAATSGKDWFDVPSTTMTPELEKTLKVLQLRPYMYKDRHYKRTGSDKGETPDFFAVGTVVDDAKDFYSTRVPKRQRKQTLAAELLADEDVQNYVRRKAQNLRAKASVLRQVRMRKSNAKLRPRVQHQTKSKKKKH